MVDIITDKNSINAIITDKLKGKNIIFTKYYRLGIAQKGLSHERVLQIFPQFDKVIAIEGEAMNRGDIGYELFYSLSNNITFSIATIPKNGSLLIIHAVEYMRDLRYRFKQR